MEAVNAPHQPPALEDRDAWARYWYYVIGVNVIPQPTKSRDPTKFNEWKPWQNKPIPEEVFEGWIKEGKFRNAEGMAIILGRVWRGEHTGEHLIFVDCDNLLAIDEFCTIDGVSVSLREDIAAKFIVEQHKDDTSRAHIYFYSEIPFVGKSSDVSFQTRQAIDNNELPAFEVKGAGWHGMAFCTPSLHKHGELYQIIGTAIKPETLNELQARQMMEHIDAICTKYGLQYLENANGKMSGNALVPIQDLFKDDAVVFENHNRHMALMRMMESLIQKLRRKVPPATIKQFGHVLNQIHCKPSYGEKDFEKAWKDAAKYTKLDKKDEEDAKKYLTNIKEGLTESQKVLSVGEAIVSKEGYRVVRGMISSVWQPFDIIESETFECSLCGSRETYEHNPPLAYSKYGNRLRSHCNTCDKETSWYFVEHSTIPAMYIELIDADAFEEIRRLTAVITDEQDIANIKVGERVTIMGNMHVIQNKSRKGAGRLYHTLYALQVEYEDREEVELTSKDIADIERFVKICKERFGGESGIIDRLVWMHSPEVIGNDFVKKGLLFLEASTGPDTSRGMSTRRRLNAGLFGPPGLGKSMECRASVRHIPNSRYESGQNSSGLSLTAMVRKDDDNYVLSVGPAAQARGAICAVNEGGWLKFTDQSQLLDIMEEGFFTVNKHGFNARIRADTSILISANPKFHAQFSDNSGDSKVELDEMPLLKTIIDRLDLMLIFKPEPDEKAIRDYIEKKSEQEDRPVRNYDSFIQKLMLHCRSFNPTVDAKAKSVIAESYVRISMLVKQNNLAFGSHRLADTLFRITKAIARLKLKKVADATDAREAIEFYNSMIMQTIGVIAIPEEPQDVAVKVMIDILKEKAKLNDMSLRELADLACLQNAQVKSYLRGSHNDIGANSRLREIAGVLLNHSSVRKGEREKPLTLRWVGSRNNNSNSSSGMNTTEIEESNSNKMNVSAHLHICKDQSVNEMNFEAKNDAENLSSPFHSELEKTNSMALEGSQIRRYTDTCNTVKEESNRRMPEGHQVIRVTSDRQDPKSKKSPTALEIVEESLANNNGKGYFTEEDFVYTLVMLPNQHWTEDQAIQTLYALVEEGKLTEIESGRYSLAI